MKRIISQPVEKVGNGWKHDLENVGFDERKKHTEVMLDQSFQILPRCHHYSFDVHLE